MSLKEALEEYKEQLAEMEKQEDAPEEVIAEEEEEPQPEEAEEPKAEDTEPEPEDEKPEAKPDDSAYARLRREKAAEKKRADDLEARLAALEKQERAEPAQEERYQGAPEMDEILRDHRMTRAEREFMQLETKFATTTPDYQDVSAEYAQALAQSIRVQNPRLSPAEIAERTKMTILQKAGTFVNQGYDPIEELYHEAKELGFTGRSMQKKEEPESKPEPKPDMRKVAANRQRSAGMAAAAGDSKPQITPQAASEFSPEEWSKLPPEEKKRLLRGG